ncbi:MAG: nucleotidyltransferase domain-containing protein [Oligoflexia bacterium]|nr:nucleotidyltransferase domain-containing protein [Oligoflexia bacterium]
MKPDPFHTVEKVLKERFPDAVLGFVAGSFIRGEETKFSDIDLVVIFKKLDFAWRESFTFDGWPVEAFVHDPETLAYFFTEVDGKDGTPSLPNMVLEGRIISDRDQLGVKLKALAQKVIDQGPPQWTSDQIYYARYQITDLIDDLRDPRNLLEASIVSMKLEEVLGNFYFRANNKWSSSLKHIPRKLLKMNRPFGEHWIKAFEDSLSGDSQAVICITEEILKPFGGLLFDGYKREAPASWRLPIDNINL